MTERDKEKKKKQGGGKGEALDRSDAGSDVGARQPHVVISLSEFTTHLMAAVDEDMDNLQKFCVDIEYKGFNPQVMYRSLAQSAARANRNFLVDMKFLIALFLTRGTRLERILTTMEASGAKDLVVELTKVYSVVSDTRNDKAAVTLPRLTATFPAVVAIMRHKGIGRTVGDPGLLPLKYQFLGSCALMVDDWPELAMYKTWAHQVGAILKFKNLQDTDKYIAIQVNANLVPMDTKLKIRTMK